MSLKIYIGGSGSAIGSIQALSNGITQSNYTNFTSSSESATTTITLDAPGYNDIYTGAVNSICYSGGIISSGLISALTTINGIAPADDGNFYIHGGMCDSVYPISGGTIFIEDMCPACKSCDTYYGLKHKVENLRLMLNAIKDANLYLGNISVTVSAATPTITSSGILGARYVNTSKDRIEATTGCTLDSSYFDDQFSIKGLQLLQQYLAAVNMWNYAVVNKETGTVIQVAPDDNTGFTVQTKIAVTDCSTTTAMPISCKISINLTAGQTTQSGFSVYLPDSDNKGYYAEYKPFADAATSSGTVTVTNNTVTSKTIYFKFGAAKYAGIYEVGLKVLPFINTTISGGTAIITPKDIDVSSAGGGSSSFHSAGGYINNESSYIQIAKGTENLNSISFTAIGSGGVLSVKPATVSYTATGDPTKASITGGYTLTWATDGGTCNLSSGTTFAQLDKIGSMLYTDSATPPASAIIGVSGGQVTDICTYCYGVSGTVTVGSQVLAPTASDYRSGKTYPSISPDVRNTWAVTVQWAKGTTDSSTKSYSYTCNGARVFASNVNMLSASYIEGSATD